MKAFFYTITWTILFLSFGFYISHKAESFANEYTSALDKIEIHIKDEEWDKCGYHIEELRKNFNHDSKIWFKLLNHCHLTEVELNFNLLIDGIYLKDVAMCLEQIEGIKISLHRLIHSEKNTLDHIL